MSEYEACEHSVARLFDVTRDLTGFKVVTDSKELAAAWKALSDKFNALKKSPSLIDKNPSFFDKVTLLHLKKRKYFVISFMVT